MYVIDVKPETLFQALSDHTRIRIVRLMAASREEVCLCEIAESLNEPEYKLSRHMKVLRQSGLLSAEKDGRWVYHKLIENSQSFSSLYKFIEDLPDNRQFQSDLKRFQKQKKSRVSGRCRSDLSEKNLQLKG